LWAKCALRVPGRVVTLDDIVTTDSGRDDADVVGVDDVDVDDDDADVVVVDDDDEVDEDGGGDDDDDDAPMVVAVRA
jgi:hypothetical protein